MAFHIKICFSVISYYSNIHCDLCGAYEYVICQQVRWQLEVIKCQTRGACHCNAKHARHITFLNHTYFYDCQDAIVGIWVCFDLEVIRLVTVDGVFYPPCIAVGGVFVCRMQAQRRRASLILPHFAGALQNESRYQSSDGLRNC